MQKEIRRVKTSNKRNYENLFTLHTTHEHDIEPPGWWNFLFKLFCFITYVSYCDLLKRILIGYFFTILHKKVSLNNNLMITWKLQSLQVYQMFPKFELKLKIKQKEVRLVTMKARFVLNHKITFVLVFKLSIHLIRI